jgi:mono/diheme cytochrome c family protein
MRRLAWIVLGILLPLTARAAETPNKTYDTPEAAAADPDFAVQGEYVGENLGVQVVALGNNLFKVVTYRGGLPGAGWNGKEKQDAEEDTAGVGDLIDTLKLKRTERKSPTIGAPAPAGAVVLFDGTKESLQKHWKEGAKITDDGLLVQGCMSTDTFQDFSLHIEFRTPYMPHARGQGRGNSGIYYQGRYETQMLDSFGLEGLDNETGGIYTIRKPDVNVCLPPLAWQTYDVDYTAAKYEDSKKVANPRITVRLNGTLVHQDVELTKTTTAAPNGEGPEPGPIYLQDHGNPVRYRNIWVLPKDAKKEARRPILPGFERIYASGNGDATEGGRMLLGELNCTSCHAADDLLKNFVEKKQAPNLEEAGKRLHAQWMVDFLSDPHTLKPGTTMPDPFANWNPNDKASTIKALVSFLASTGTMVESSGDSGAAKRGENLFHTIGCVACHAAKKGDATPLATSVPLTSVERKYSIPSLVEFLKNPQHVRSSGRMPAMHLQDAEAKDLANYLLGDVVVSKVPPNMSFAVYHGAWNNVPKFDDLKPVKTGLSRGLDLSVAGRENGFAVWFEGFFEVKQDGKYKFHLGSDDGSIAYVDGNKVVDVDGVHPHSEKTGQVDLKAGIHKLRVEYFQGGGEWTVALEFEGPKTPRQMIDRIVAPTADDVGKKKDAPVDPGQFVADPNLIETGRRYFGALGCASCHNAKADGQTIASTVKAKPLKDLKPEAGCLATTPKNPGSASSPVPPLPSIPEYDLSATQRNALVLALTNKPVHPQPQPEDLVRTTMASFNCFACHARGSLGGPELARNLHFKTAEPEMGDEGRIPPPLDGVGDKLNDEWLREVTRNGAKDRDYMRTRMPKFGGAVGEIDKAFVSIDHQPTGEFPAFDEPIHKVKATGRLLVGETKLACIKCHQFGEMRATGIQAINLQTMTRRIRPDWFLRYLPDPQKYRPGTRMPTGFPNGQATIRDVYAGNPPLQIAAIWTYLLDGNKAGIPDGLLAQAIELKPDGASPVIYRNFIDGVSPRAIGIGYPELANLAWDANTMSLAMIWHGKFIDASKHWVGRGPGFQGPLGDDVMKLESVASIAVLDDPGQPWPTGAPRERGYRFRGFKLDAQQRPAFAYDTDKFSVVDFAEPKMIDKDPTFVRKLTITAKDSERIYFRAVTSSNVDAQTDGAYLIDKSLKTKVTGSVGQPIERNEGGRKEILYPVIFKDGKAEIVQELIW